jgi:hypothetical protein
MYISNASSCSSQARSNTLRSGDDARIPSTSATALEQGGRSPPAPAIGKSPSVQIPVESRCDRRGWAESERTTPSSSSRRVEIRGRSGLDLEWQIGGRVAPPHELRPGRSHGCTPARALKPRWQIQRRL